MGKLLRALILWAQHQEEIPLKKQTFIQNLSAAVPAGGTYELFSITVPTKTKFRLLSFGNYTNVYASWGYIYWTFTLNGLPFYPYEIIKDQIGTGALRQAIQTVEIFGGSNFKIRAFNPTADIVGMGISIKYELVLQ